MSVRYFYSDVFYDTEAEAQSAVSTQRDRLENNPCDWVLVKEISGSNENGWVVTPTPLTDSNLLNLDASKTYTLHCEDTGETLMPLTSTEVSSKIDEFRTIHAQRKSVNTIRKVVEAESDDGIDTYTEIPTDLDMTKYL